ncbi:MAG TPA: lytic transglycosylase domain-containing protein [Verrucomicrobiae bacterium]
MRKRKWLWFFLVLALVDGLFLFLWLTQKKEHRYDNEIVAAATKYGMHPALIKAVVWKESRFDADARGSAQELGLMQIREPAAMEWAEAEKRKGFEHKDLLDPKLNTLAGTWYLRKLMRRYLHTDDPLPYALADYNAGRTHVLRWNKGAASTNSAAFMTAMDYPGTKQYIIDVAERFKHYQAEFPTAQPAQR